jgi:hypothetical protein
MSNKAVCAPPDSRWMEELEFRLISVAVFVTILAVASVSYLMPWRWSFGPQAEKRKSIFEEAREASSTMTGIAFMG